MLSMGDNYSSVLTFIWATGSRRACDPLNCVPRSGGGLHTCAHTKKRISIWPVARATPRLEISTSSDSRPTAVDFVNTHTK